MRSQLTNTVQFIFSVSPRLFSLSAEECIPVAFMRAHP
jgi:hypothetical protein